ncbi:MAG: hypothetical protein ACKOHK_13730 [Planctomycetia bacterium]
MPGGAGGLSAPGGVDRFAILPRGGFSGRSAAAKREFVLLTLTAAGRRFDRFPCGRRL